MGAPLLDQVADKVLRESLRVRSGESVAIEAWNTGLGFAERVSVRARRMGAFPLLLFEDEEAYVEGVRQTPPRWVGKMGPHEYALLAKTDAYVFVPAPVLGGASSRLSPAKTERATAYNAAWYAAAKRARLRGVRLLFGYVGPEMARALGKPVREIVDHQLRGALVDLRKVQANARWIATRLRAGSWATLRTEAGVLRFQTGTEDGLDAGVVGPDKLAAGENMVNIPPGYYGREIVPGTMSGAVTLHAPVPRLRDVVDLRFEFEHGKLTSWECPGHPEWLNERVRSTPLDRRRLASVIIGLNPALRRGYGRDGLVEAAVSFFGMIQCVARSADLDLDGRPVVANDAFVTRKARVATSPA
jgi:aminopeptidase